MNERRGLVVERSHNKVTAVTKSGEFVSWRDRRDLMPGEEVIVPSPRFQGFVWRRLVPATALAAILIFMSFFGYQQYLYARPIMAYVTFDSGGAAAGSIELEVNDRGLVKSAVALDEAGADALAQVNCEMKPVQTVLASLSQALPEAGEAVVAFIPVKTAPDEDIESEGENDSKDERKDNKKETRINDLEKKVFDSVKTATGIVLDTETRDEAKELGISAGRAASWALWKHESGEDAPDHDDDPAEQPGEAAPLVQPEEPGQPGHGEPPAKPEHPDVPGQSNPHDQSETEPRDDLPPGQQKKDDAEALLNTIRSTLPQFNIEESAKDNSKEFGKRAGEVTKEWLKAVKEMTKQAAEDNRHEEREEEEEPENRGDSDEETSRQQGQGNSGKDQDKPDKDNSNPRDGASPSGDSDPKPTSGRAQPQQGGTKPEDSDPDSPGNSRKDKGSSEKDQRDSSLAGRIKWTSEFLRSFWK